MSTDSKALPIYPEIKDLEKRLESVEKALKELQRQIGFLNSIQDYGEKR